MNINGELSLTIFRYCNRNHTVRIYLYFHFKLSTTFIITFEITVRNECILYIYILTITDQDKSGTDRSPEEQ